MNHKKILFSFTKESEEELKMYGFDAEKELISILSNEISKEIDKQKINDLIILTIDRNVCERKVLFEKLTLIKIGFKSETFLESGYVYAPYIPMVEQTIIEEGNFFPSKELESRYATKKINSNFYGPVEF